MFAVLPDGPAVQDGGGSSALCALHQTQRRQAGAAFLRGEGDGAAALHGDPGDGEHPPPGLLPPHPLGRVRQQVQMASGRATANYVLSTGVAFSLPSHEIHPSSTCPVSRASSPDGISMSVLLVKMWDLCDAVVFR